MKQNEQVVSIPPLGSESVTYLKSIVTEINYSNPFRMGDCTKN